MKAQPKAGVAKAGVAKAGVAKAGVVKAAAPKGVPANAPAVKTGVVKAAPAKGGAGGGIAVPVELVEALAGSPEAKALFERMPPSHRLEYARHVAEARKEETRVRRAQAALPMILRWGAGRG